MPRGRPRKKKKVIRKALAVSKVLAFKIKNRRGYATIALNSLTEGRTLPQAYDRLMKAVRRLGYELPADKLPAVK